MKAVQRVTRTKKKTNINAGKKKYGKSGRTKKAWF